jgi:Ran GTPase-activating protein (RanGAP) involved in mRNA processing and transport
LLLTSSGFRYSQELISAITVTNPTHINLSNKSFDNGAAEKVAEYVRSLEGVTVADISDIIAGRPEDEALRTLSIICSSLKKFKLIEVNLSDNALGAKGVDACKDILLGNDLEVSYGNRWSVLGTNSLLLTSLRQRLLVCNNGLSAEAGELLAKILLREGEYATEGAKVPSLKLFHFYNNMGGDGAAKAVARIVDACPQLEDFRFSATRSTPVGCESIATVRIVRALYPSVHSTRLID